MQVLTGRPAPRLEDARLLTGGAQFLADIAAGDALEAVFVRGDVACGRITELDLSAVEQAPGVVAVYDASRIGARVDPFPSIFHKIPPALTRQIDITLHGRPAPLLAQDRVRRSGEPIAVVIATSRALAEDAAELANVRIAEEPAVLDVADALTAGAAPVFDDRADNLQARFRVHKGDAAVALGECPRQLRQSYRINRQVGTPMEPRGVLARFDKEQRLLTVWDTTQHQHLLRNTIAAQLHLAQDEVRVIVPDMGGSFGGGMYPEDILIPFIAMDLGRPVRWIERRWENLSDSRHSRDQLHDITVGFDESGTILALQDQFAMDTGVHNFFGPILGYNTASHLIGQYRIENYDVECTVTLSNKTPNSPVRGAGRLEAAFVMDRVIDSIADELGIDTVDVRRRNLVPGDAMPYTVGFPYRDGKPYVYDSGDYPHQLETALAAVDYPALRAEQQRLRAAGRHVGIGIGSYLEASGYGPFEPALVRIEPTGKVVVHSGAAPHGQSHQTMLTNLCADALAVAPDAVSVRTGDSSLLPFGVGTFASRGAVTSGSAVRLAAEKVRAKLLTAAARLLGVAEDELVLDGGQVFVRGREGHSLSYAEVAIALVPATPLANELGPGLVGEEYFIPPAVTVASGTHVAVVEVDKVTGQVAVLRYVVVHDCGKALNPIVVHGQICGGVAHGLGCTLFEEVVYDSHGAPLTADLGSYLLTTAAEMPDVEIIDEDWPSPLNPLGAKGVGEGGAVGPAPAVSNAIVDALRPLRVPINELPVTPDRLRAAIRRAEAGAA